MLYWMLLTSFSVTSVVMAASPEVVNAPNRASFKMATVSLSATKVSGIKNKKNETESSSDGKNCGQSIEYRKINPTKYRIRIHNASNSLNLVFNERFDKQWRAYIVPIQEIKAGGFSRPIDNKQFDRVLTTRAAKLHIDDDEATANEIKNYVHCGMVTSIGGAEFRDRFISINHYGSIQNNNLPVSKFWETWFPHELKPDGNGDMNETPEGGIFNPYTAKWEFSGVPDERVIEWPEALHQIANTFANGWFFDLGVLRLLPETREGFPGYYIKNIDKSLDFEVVIEYRSQRFVYLAYMISSLSIIACMVMVIFLRKSLQE